MKYKFIITNKCLINAKKEGNGGRPIRRPLGAHTIFTTNRWIAFFVDCCIGGRNVCYWFQPTNQNCYVYKYSMFCTRFLSPSICCHFMFNWLFQLLYLLFIPVSRSMGDSLYTQIVTYMCNIIRVAPVKIQVIFRIFNARELDVQNSSKSFIILVYLQT